MPIPRSSIPWRNALVAAALPMLIAGCGSGDDDNNSGRDGPDSSVAPVVHQTGNATTGRDVFRFELFGNERFWTDAMRLQQGVVAAGVTPCRRCNWV